ncbi:TPA: hypothetical protein ACPZQN_004475 [Yersinia enterocolitica]|uniref:hypothetical protein n=1 Tax=Yersinia enterocolitica TaxID=630 RepID=UPI0021E7D4ED|nr:hypothetical protein [Yersinia enterocolitica]UYJ87126.1 hypothetical protein N4W04_10860 [Yersinia enterocolitica]UYK12878.1 hypothetical protein N4224_13065 [Yersinia enterocolitica]HDY4895935.1 hypothetical protein [Yersinia enterocolitica]
MTTIDSPLDLWRSLCSSAGLELRLKGGRLGRDADVEELLRQSLAVPETVTSLDTWLISDAASSHPTISTEQLLIELLKSQVGFAQMIKDILDVLIIAEAKQTSHQLTVEFKFDNVTDPIKATLEQFREVVHRTQLVLEKRPKLPNSNLMWSISGVLTSFLADYPRNNPPADFPPVIAITPTMYKGIDVQLARISRLVSDFIELWRLHGDTRKQVRDVALTMNNIDSEADVLRGQLFAAFDNWDVGVLSGAQNISSQVVSGKLDPEVALETLTEALSEIEWADIWVDHTIRDLLDVLNLPAWRRRHELYSVWAGTRMLAVVERIAPDMRFHPVDGVLSFEFGGSRLATFNWGNKQFDVWAELRSALVGRSRKRKKGIQPDFRVLQADISKSANMQTTYVLECKHYLNANTSNFTQAAADYARSCPNAVVHVVNHGPADEQLLNAVLPTELQSRAQFIGSATPLQDAATQALSNAIRDAIFPGLPPPEPISLAPKPVASKTESALIHTCVGYVQLEWDDSLEDMDLVLRAIGPDGQVIYSVDFCNKGALEMPPFALLDEDVRHGPGKERIDISSWHFSRYELLATNYSKSGQMTPQAMHCTIVTDNSLTQLRCPVELESSCYEWKIAELTILDGIVTIVPVP